LLETARPEKVCNKIPGPHCIGGDSIYTVGLECRRTFVIGPHPELAVPAYRMIPIIRRVHRSKGVLRAKSPLEDSSYNCKKDVRDYEYKKSDVRWCSQLCLTDPLREHAVSHSE
jgi:hypothetical protein